MHACMHVYYTCIHTFQGDPKTLDMHQNWALWFFVPLQFLTPSEFVALALSVLWRWNRRYPARCASHKVGVKVIGRWETKSDWTCFFCFYVVCASGQHGSCIGFFCRYNHMMIDDRYFRPVGMWAGQPFVKRKQRLMTVWEQEQNRTQNWLTPSAKIWPRLNHHLESDVFPLSFPESQKVWMKQHKRGPSLTTWEPSQFQFFQPLPLKELNAETCRNQIFLKSWRMPGKDMKNMAWKCLKHFLWSSFVFSQFFRGHISRFNFRHASPRDPQANRLHGPSGCPLSTVPGVPVPWQRHDVTCPSCLSKNSSNITRLTKSH